MGKAGGASGHLFPSIPPFYTLGYSLCYVWTFIFDSSASSDIVSMVGLSDTIIELVVLAAYAFLWKVIDARRRGFTAILWATGAAGVAYALMTFGAHAGISAASASVISDVLYTIFTLGMFVLWCDLFGSVPLLEAVKVIGLSYIAVVLVDAAVSFLPAESYFGMAILLPVLCAQCLSRSHDSLRARYGTSTLDSSLRSILLRKAVSLDSLKRHGADLALFPWQIVLVVVAIPFVSNIVECGSSLGVDVLSFGLAGATVLVLFMVLRQRFSVFSIMSVLLPVMLLGLLAISLLDWLLPAISQACIQVSSALRLIFIMIAVSDRSFRFGLSAVFFASVFRALSKVGGELGSMINSSVSLIPLGGGSQEAVLHLVGIVVLIVVLAIWLRSPLSSSKEFADEVAGSGDNCASATPDSRQGSDAFAPDTQIDAVSCEKPTSVVDAAQKSAVDEASQSDSAERLESEIDQGLDAYRSMLSARCDELSRENHLSARESEVLLYLARGMSVPRIEKELFISGNTVKTHVRHIYRKLGIHSRDELKILIGIE